MFQSTRPARGATFLLGVLANILGFQSTRPARGATPKLDAHGRLSWFQSTRPARGATRGSLRIVDDHNVSIHAPRTGRDAVLCGGRAPSVVSIHAPRTGRDEPSACWSHCMAFQSTRPARGATRKFRASPSTRISFNPRAPHGARQPTDWANCLPPEFQSTRPARGATGIPTLPIT